MSYVIWFHDVDAQDGSVVGGKFASLAEMHAAGFGVPLAFAVTTKALATFMHDRGLEEEARAVNAGIERGKRLRERILETDLPPSIARAIVHAYRALCEQTGVDDVPVAVRSSGAAEDLAEASFAGQYDTYLWIRGASDVLDHVRLCWTGLYAPTVLSYRPGSGAGDVGMAVVVQQLVEPRSAGVMFTLDPVTGDRSKIVIEGSWGLGEAVVSGEVTPDRFRVDKVTLEILERVISDKEREYCWQDGEVAVRTVDDGRRSSPCLRDDDVSALAILAKRIELHRDAPQDIEWAIDRAGAIHVLQVRPETVWSRHEAAPVTATGKSAVDLVLGTFVSGRLPRGEATR